MSIPALELAPPSDPAGPRAGARLEGRGAVFGGRPDCAGGEAALFGEVGRGCRIGAADVRRAGYRARRTKGETLSSLPLPRTTGAGDRRAPSLDIPQCWPMPFRADALKGYPAGPLESPRSARSWTGTCFGESPPRPAGFYPIALPGCRIIPDCKLRASRVLRTGTASIATGAHTLGPRPSEPRQAQKPLVLQARCVFAQSARLGAGGFRVVPSSGSCRLRCGPWCLAASSAAPSWFCWIQSQPCFAAASVRFSFRLFLLLLEVPPSARRSLHLACQP